VVVLGRPIPRRRARRRRDKVILVRSEDVARRTSTACTRPRGILTSRGGMTSHAAVVARGWGKSCVVGCSALRVRTTNAARSGSATSWWHEGDPLTLDGGSGEVMLGRLPTVNARARRRVSAS